MRYTPVQSLDKVPLRSLEMIHANQKLKVSYRQRKNHHTTICFLHGGACSQQDFCEAFSRTDLTGFDLLSFDFPGCGRSSYPKDAHFGIDDLVEITEKVFNKLNIEYPIIVGHSMGGLIGLLSILRTGNAQAFICVEGNLAPQNAIFSRQVASAENYEDFRLRLLPKLQKELEQSGNPGFRYWAENLSRSSPQAFYDVCPSLVGYSDHGELLEKYAGLEIPTLYIYGDENETMLSFLPYLKENRVPIAAISQSNHFPFHDNPAEFYEALLKFVNEKSLS